MYLAEPLERIRSGEEQTISLNDVMKRHGLQRRTVCRGGPGTRQARCQAGQAHPEVPS